VKNFVRKCSFTGSGRYYKYTIELEKTIEQTSSMADEQPKSKTEQIQERWNQLADWYSKTVAMPLMPVGIQLCTALSSCDNPNVLEVACGDGRLAERMGDIHPEMAYTGIDLAQSMVDLAKVRCPNHNFSTGDAEALTFADNSFDIYLSSLCLQIVANPSKMMQEAYRVLKPGGVAGFSIWGPRNTSSFWNALSKAHDSINDEPLGSLSNFHLSNDDFTELKEVIAESGFKRNVQWNSKICMPILSGEEFVKFWPSKDLDEDKRAEFEKVLSTAGDECVANNEPISFAVTFIILRKTE